MISFRGHLDHQTHVNETYNYLAITAIKPVSFVEMNPYDRDDRQTLNSVKRIYGSWGPDASLINDIFQYEGQSHNNMRSRYFVLSEQLHDFKKIMPSTVLSVMKTTDMDRKNVFIDMLQVNPWYVFNRRWDPTKNAPISQFKHCGMASLDSLKKIFSDKNLWINVPAPLIDYFKYNGFQIIKKASAMGDALMEFTRPLRKVAK